MRHRRLRQDRYSKDTLDVPLHDGVLLAELELTTAMIIAASEAVGLTMLPEKEIDRLLGVTPSE